MAFIFPKLLYLSVYTLFGSAIAYLALFYDEALHLTSSQIGLLLAITPFVQFVSCPVWTVVVDKRPNWHGPLMALLAVVGGLAVMGLLLISRFLVDTTAPDGNQPEQDGDNQRIVLMAAAALAFVFAFCGQPTMTLVDSAVLKILGDQKILYGECGQ